MPLNVNCWPKSPQYNSTEQKRIENKKRPYRVSNHYAAITISGKPLSIGVSSLAGCKRMCPDAVTRHAEMDALSRIKNKDRLKKAELWSIRWTKGTDDGEYVMANAKPCVLCKRLALRMGIKTCYYSDNDGTIVKENLIDVESKYTVGSVIQMRNMRGYQNVPFRLSRHTSDSESSSSS